MEADDIREAVLDLISTHARPRGISKEELLPHRALTDLGIDSVGTITILLELESEMGLKLDSAFRLTAPETVGDIVTLALARTHA
jgi:acyl carrier protein